MQAQLELRPSKSDSDSKLKRKNNSDGTSKVVKRRVINNSTTPISTSTTTSTSTCTHSSNVTTTPTPTSTSSSAPITSHQNSTTDRSKQHKHSQHHHKHKTDHESSHHRKDKHQSIHSMKHTNRLARDLSESIDLTDDNDYEVIDILDDDDDGKTTTEQLKENTKELNERSTLSKATCCVCLDSPEKIAVTPCGHLYCSDCIFRALSSAFRANATKGECSICRRKVPYNRVTFLELRLPGTETNSKIEMKPATKA